MPEPTFTAAHPHIHRVRVVADDIDEQGRVSNERYLAWIMQAAVSHSTSLGWPWPRFVELGAMFVVRRHEIDYLAPAFEGDELLCATWPSFMKAATAYRRHEIVRARDGAVLCRGFNVWAFVSMEGGRPVRIPPELARDFDPARFAGPEDPGAEWRAGRPRRKR